MSIHPGFGRHDGACAAQVVFILDLDDRFFVHLEHGSSTMSGFKFPFMSTSIRGMSYMSNGNMEGVIHFKLFV